MWRLALYVAVPTLLVVMSIGPGVCWDAVKRGWKWLWRRNLEPEEILASVVREQRDHVEALRKALAQAETAEADIRKNIVTSDENIALLEMESHDLAARNDDLGTRAALYKLALERVALANFKEQLDRHSQLIVESRQRLYQLELQLRQYEVGRSILLSQLAEATTTKQQYAIANEFDPFSAVANWQRAHGMVEEKTDQARAAERVHADTAGLFNPADLDAQLTELKARLAQERTDKQSPIEEKSPRPRTKKLEGK